MVATFRNLKHKVCDLGLLLFLSSSIVVLAQEDVIKVDTNLVSIPVSVTDRDGRFVPGLKKEDFRIFENSIEQDLLFFAESEEPFTVLVLLDRSGSMSYRMEDLAGAANAFMGQLRPRDTVFAASFADSVTEILAKTRVSEIRNGIRIHQRRDESNTFIFDAVDNALGKLAKVRGRKALIIFSDGAGNGLSASAKSNIRDAEEGEALIYTIRFDTFSSGPPKGGNKKAWFDAERVATNYMTDLAAKTGGRSFRVETIANLAETFRTVAEELGRVYTVGYSAEDQGRNNERRKITVKVNIPNVAVRSRNEVVFKKK